MRSSSPISLARIVYGPLPGGTNVNDSPLPRRFAPASHSIRAARTAEAACRLRVTIRAVSDAPSPGATVAGPEISIEISSSPAARTSTATRASASVVTRPPARPVAVTVSVCSPSCANDTR